MTTKKKEHVNGYDKLRAVIAQKQEDLEYNADRANRTEAALKQAQGASVGFEKLLEDKTHKLEWAESLVCEYMNKLTGYRMATLDMRVIPAVDPRGSADDQEPCDGRNVMYPTRHHGPRGIHFPSEAGYQ